MMAATPDIGAIANKLIAAYDGAAQIAPISSTDPSFDVPMAYEVLREIEARRRITQGWQPVGRKIGFTNRTIWPRYGVYVPMWAHVWSHTVHYAKGGRETLDLKGFVEPRIEPEVVFRLAARVPPTGGAAAILDCIEWIAPGFEIVQSHFPGWKFTAADCTAAFGLHGALVIGTPLRLSGRNRARIAELLPKFTLTLSRDGEVVETGIGANVLDSPALAVGHLAHVLATQPQFPPLAAGEVITTGTLTDAWPVKPGQTWSSYYGDLGIGGLTLALR
jgi:2-oxo-3-hexenedioate decarboxylase